MNDLARLDVSWVKYRDCFPRGGLPRRYKYLVSSKLGELLDVVPDQLEDLWRLFRRTSIDRLNASLSFLNHRLQTLQCGSSGNYFCTPHTSALRNRARVLRGFLKALERLPGLAKSLFFIVSPDEASVCSANGVTSISIWMPLIQKGYPGDTLLFKYTALDLHFEDSDFDLKESMSLMVCRGLMCASVPGIESCSILQEIPDNLTDLDRFMYRYSGNSDLG